MPVSAHRDWIDLHSSTFILFLLAVRFLMNIFIMLHIHFIPCLYEYRRSVNYENGLCNVLTVPNRGMLWVLKNRILNNNLSIGVPNDHGKCVASIIIAKNNDTMRTSKSKPRLLG